MNENEKIARECEQAIVERVEAAGWSKHIGLKSLIQDAITRATEGLKADNERMREGEKWAATMFCNIMVQAMGGIADSAIVAHQKYTAEHSLAAVKQLAETTKDLRAQLAASNERIKNIECLIEGYIDGAPDASLASKLANHIALLLSTPATKEEKR